MKNQKAQHPLDALAETIQSQGVAVLEGVTRMPTYGEPYVSPLLIIALNHRGVVKCSYDRQPAEFHPHDISVITPNHVLTPHESSPDYLCTLLVVDASFFHQFQQLAVEYHKEFYMLTPHFHLTDGQYEMMHATMQLLAKACRHDGAERTRFCAYLMNALGCLLKDYRLQGMKDQPEPSANSRLFNRFYQAIIEHHRESHEVQYYADLLNLSPKYFGTVIRQTTGIKASQWIVRYVITQAKSLFAHRPDLTIQQIAHQLGFPDQMTFSRYFKANAGMSPKKYRSQF